MPVTCSTATSKRELPDGNPEARIDLGTAEGLRQVRGEWRYSSVKLVEADFLGTKTYDYTPRAGVAEYDDSRWEILAPSNLKTRREGRLSFNWYRINVSIPQSVGNIDLAGTTVVFETSIDDYAEVWVDGELPRWAGQVGGSVIAGWNVPNRLVIARNVKAGQKIQIAVFGINGPLSAAPPNPIFMRYAILDFYRGASGPVALNPSQYSALIKRLGPDLDAIVGDEPKIVKLADGFEFSSSPAWTVAGHLLFRDLGANITYKYIPDGARLEKYYFDPHGNSRADAPFGGGGSFDLAFDPQGRLTVAEQENRRIIRVENDGRLKVLADTSLGTLLKGPHDLVYRSDGALFFTDTSPTLKDSQKKLGDAVSTGSVFSLVAGKLRLVANNLPEPRGITLSADEKYLYVASSGQHNVVMRYTVDASSTISDGKGFFSMPNAMASDAISGIKVDHQGNIYVAGADGVWIVSPDGKQLGTLLTPKKPRSLAWGDADFKSLYMCAPNALYRIKLGIPGQTLSARGPSLLRGSVRSGPAVGEPKEGRRVLLSKFPADR